MSVKLLRASSFTSINLSDGESAVTQGTNAGSGKIVIYCDDECDNKSTAAKKRKKRDRNYLFAATLAITIAIAGFIGAGIYYSAAHNNAETSKSNGKNLRDIDSESFSRELHQLGQGKSIEEEEANSISVMKKTDSFVTRFEEFLQKEFRKSTQDAAMKSQLITAKQMIDEYFSLRKKKDISKAILKAKVILQLVIILADGSKNQTKPKE